MPKTTCVTSQIHGCEAKLRKAWYSWNYMYSYDIWKIWYLAVENIEKTGTKVDYQAWEESVTRTMGERVGKLCRLAPQVKQRDSSEDQGTDFVEVVQHLGKVWKIQDRALKWKRNRLCPSSRICWTGYKWAKNFCEIPQKIRTELS